MFLKRRSDSFKLLSALLMAVQQSLGRFILWASVHGVDLPWLAWAERAVLPSTLDRYRRRAMISQLRAQRYRIARGPYFLRSRLEKTAELFRLIQFPVLLSAKVLLALLICIAPFFVFFVVRIYLPVEQRIAVNHVAFDSKLFSSARAVQPTVFSSQAGSPSAYPPETPHQKFDAQIEREADWIADEEVDLLQGQGSAHAEIRRGWIINSTVEKIFQFRRFGEPLNLRFRYRPIPTDDAQLECALRVSRPTGEILYAGTFNASSLSRQVLVRSPLTRGLQEKLLPEFARNRVTAASHQVSVGFAAGDTRLKIRIETLGGRRESGACQALVYGFEVSGSRRIEREVNDSRSLLLISFDSLHADLALNEALMPWLSGFLTSPRTMHFAQHHALDVRKGQSLRTLLGLTEGGAPQTELVKQASNISKLRQNGYRVVLVGNFKRVDDFLREVQPDVVVRIENETYEPSLVLSELRALLDEEGSTPLLVLMRLNGMNAPWRPFASDISFGTSAFQGSVRSASDSLIRSHLKSLDKILAKNLSTLESQGLFEKMDLAITAERGFDLGLNRTTQRAHPTRSAELLLNQETLRVPLGVALAKSTERELHHLLKTQYYLTTHHDLARTLWENFGVFDMKFAPHTVRIWKKDDFYSSTRSSLRFSARKTEDEMRRLAIKSKVQEGVIFSEPGAVGGFLKYVSQSHPTRVTVPKVSGWKGSIAVDVDAGERFFQVSQRGRREEVVNRVNSQFLREARRILRQERKLPLRFIFTANAEQRVDLKLEERSAEVSQMKILLPDSLSLNTEQLSQSVIEHHITGVAREGDVFELRGGASQLRLATNDGEGLLVACPEAFHFTFEAINEALMQKVLCLLDAPIQERLDSFRVLNKKTLSFWLAEDEQQTCSNENSGINLSADNKGCKSATDPNAARL